MTINDALINRMFARCFPAPIILGIEEYLNGPLLSFLNEDGYVALGFEAGQHDEREAVENAKAFIWLALAKSGFLSDTRYRQVGVAASRLRRASGGKSSFYEITYRLSIAPGDSFEMQPGFRNFDPVAKGSLLAIHNGVPLYTKTKVLLFMPLYQKQGEDGYFLIRFIPAWIMSLSAFLRRLKLDALFPLLPGVGRYPGNSAKLVVNLKLVRFFSRRFFHLMGYRHKQADMHHAIFTNRERMAKNECYREESWYRDSHGCN